MKKIIIYILTLLVLVFQSITTEAKNKKKPNIILMMADDMGWGDTGFNGNTIIKTPNLDNMAADGMKLNHFYSIGPVCSPTRASFLTGRHYYRLGVWSANKGHLPKEEFTIARMLKADGYATGHFGKWHLGTLSKSISAKGPGRKPELNFAPPWERDYDESFVTESAVTTWDPGIGPRAKNNPYYHNGIPIKDPYTENVLGDDSRVLMDRAIPFIQNAVKEGQPFVAVIWFHAPHENIQAGPDYLKMYKGYGEAAHYYGCITALDDQVGRLRAELKKLGVDDNTALFFCSDNGPEGSEPNDRMKTRRAGSTGGLTGRKRSMHEGGVRVPAIALVPGVTKAGTECDVPLSVLDYLPTIKEMTGAKYVDNRPLDGQDITNILNGREDEHPMSIPFRFNNKNGSWAGLVKGKYKLLIQSKEDSSKDMLFDLSSDIKEENNLASRKPQQVKDMRTEIIEFLKSSKESHRGVDYGEKAYLPIEKWQTLGEKSVKSGKKKNKKKNKK